MHKNHGSECNYSDPKPKIKIQAISKKLNVFLVWEPFKEHTTIDPRLAGKSLKNLKHYSLWKVRVDKGLSESDS